MSPLNSISPTLSGLTPPSSPPTTDRSSRSNSTARRSPRLVDEVISIGATSTERSIETPGTPTEQQKQNKYPRISKPVELIKRDYDVVVIGSGYGGGVAASRMARGRQSVCVLEIGQERWPGEYPEDIKEARRQLRISGNFSTEDIGPKPVGLGNVTDLYQLVVGAEQNAFVAHGLGGTSLLNANVFLEADEESLKIDAWPEEIRDDPQCLRKYYQRARDVLEPQVYPDDFPELPKLNLLKEQAKKLGYENKFRKVEQTTWFKEDGLNSSGVRMKKSKLTGMDSTGVNDGSKSSTLMNYLADAWNWGAEIFTRCEVRYIKKHAKEGYLIYFAWHGSGRWHFKENFHEDLMWVHAKKMVFLGAGALGTTEILLRSRDMGLSMSKNVGENMSGNGDLLAFGYNLNTNVNGLARPDPEPDAPIGPTITGVIDCRDTPNPLDGFVIEEGAIPAALAPFMQFMLEILPGRDRPQGIKPLAQFSKAVAGMSSRLFGPYTPNGSLQRTQTYLIMSHDSNQATLTLENNKPNLEFHGVGRLEHIQKLNDKLRRMTAAFDGTFVNNPFFALNSQEITVHPIGGASMSRDGQGANGVTNHAGQVFSGEGSEIHEGLAVVDGSLIPAALGANPFATITALAERSVDLIAQQYGIEIDLITKNGELDFSGMPEHPIIRRAQSTPLSEEFVNSSLRSGKEGMGFTEIMSGHIHIGSELEDFEAAHRVAKARCEEARFFLSMHSYDTKTMIDGKRHGNLTGTFTSGALPASPYMVVGGEWYPFCADSRLPDTKNMDYDFDMVGTDGSKIHFYGYKKINDSSAFSVSRVWKATTTLLVTLTEPTDSDDAEPRVIGRGILEINPRDFVTELRSFYSNLNTRYTFFGWFLKNLTNVFFAPFDRLSWPTHSFEPRSAANDPTQRMSVRAKDGVVSQLMMWDPLSQNEREMDILFIGGAAVDEKIFASPTIKKNAMNFFREKGYRCFAVVHRVGRCENARSGYTTFDARLDIAATINKIQELRSSGKCGRMGNKTYIIAHCVGSVALSAGLLTGDIRTSSIAGITASQVFMNPRFPKVNRWKSSIPYSTTLYSTLSGSQWFDCVSGPGDTFFQTALNQILRAYPVQRTDFCNSPTCHRSSFIFGLLWAHDNLNEETHSKLHKFLGGTSMATQRHIIKMGRTGRVLRNNGENDLVTNENIKRLRGIPILFLTGERGCVFSPDNTLTSFDTLRRRLDEKDYERQPFQNYGHLDLWMSDYSADEVYPRVNDHLEMVLKRMQNQTTNGIASNGLAINGVTVNGVAVNGHAVNGEASNGHVTTGRDGIGSEGHDLRNRFSS